MGGAGARHAALHRTPVRIALEHFQLRRLLHQMLQHVAHMDQQLVGGAAGFRAVQQQAAQLFQTLQARGEEFAGAIGQGRARLDQVFEVALLDVDLDLENLGAQLGNETAQLVAPTGPQHRQAALGHFGGLMEIIHQRGEFTEAGNGVAFLIHIFSEFEDVHGALFDARHQFVGFLAMRLIVRTHARDTVWPVLH